MRTEKDICLLCQDKPAIQKGSHVIPAFLIASMIGKRGREESHAISSSLEKKIDTFFGRENPKNWEETHPFHYDEIKEHHYTQDFLFCANCETNILGKFEAGINERIIQKIRKHDFASIPTYQLAEDDYHSMFIFVFSIFLRVSWSEGEFAAYQLPPEKEKDFATAVRKFLLNGFSLEEFYETILEKYNLKIGFIELNKDQNNGLCQFHNKDSGKMEALINDFLFMIESIPGKKGDYHVEFESSADYNKIAEVFFGVAAHQRNREILELIELTYKEIKGKGISLGEEKRILQIITDEKYYRMEREALQKKIEELIVN